MSLARSEEGGSVDARTDQLTSAPDAVAEDAAPRIDVTERPDGVTRIDWRDDAAVRPGGVTRSGEDGTGTPAAGPTDEVGPADDER
jgi:hypothetical protein